MKLCQLISKVLIIVCVCYTLFFDGEEHEQERSRNYFILPNPTQLRIVPENSIISMGTY